MVQGHSQRTIPVNEKFDACASAIDMRGAMQALLQWYKHCFNCVVEKVERSGMKHEGTNRAMRAMSAMNQAPTIFSIDWPQYVKNMAVLHRLELDDSRTAEVILQMQHIHALAQRFLDFPLAAGVDPAPTFRP